MGLLNILSKKEKTQEIPVEIKPTPASLVKTMGGNNQGIDIRDLSDYYGLFSPRYVTENFVTIYTTMGEVFFPINYIVNRIKGGNYILKNISDDSAVFNNKEINHFLETPNPLFSFEEMTEMFFVYRYVTGDAYMTASVPDSFRQRPDLWKWCDNYWILPSTNVSIKTPFWKTLLFSTYNKNEIIKSYDLSNPTGILSFSPDLVLHSKESNIVFDQNYLNGKSRLLTQKYTIANLAAVYEARNVIYVKRGALGFLISKKYDATGSLPMTDKEKKAVRDEYERTYGLSSDKSMLGIINTPTDFIRLNMSISELEPFEETLNDACQIAGVYGIPSVLIPRKDQSTFSNQENAEISVYTGSVIPEAKRYCKMLTTFLGLQNSGLYLDVDFSHVEVLQKREKEKASSKKLISEKCKVEFFNGVITLNDWRAQIGESRVNNPLYDKLILFMLDDEIDKIRTMLNLGQKTAVQVSV